MFRAATARVKEPFSRSVGQSLGEALVSELGTTPNACWLFCSPANGLKDLLHGVLDAVSTQTLVGCTTDGEVSTAGFSTESAVLAGIATDQIRFHVVQIEALGVDSEKAGVELGKSFPEPISHLQLFSDGITGNGCAILRGLASTLGPELPVSGGTAGDAGRFERTWQFAGPNVLTDAAVGIGFSGDFKLGTGVRSGWSPVGTVKKVTRAKGNVVYELNGQPALEVYERFLGKHADKLPSVGVEYPLGLVSESGGVSEEGFELIRATMAVNRGEGSISFAGEIPQGSSVRLTCGDYASILKATEDATRLALDDLRGSPPLLVFFYSCMARKLVLGRRTQQEFEILVKTMGSSVPLIGFYTYGEYCRAGSECQSLLHNETATVSMIGV